MISIEEPEETGTTFMENALLKARYYAKATNRPCLADDSGITLDVLNGAPGVYSARYAGHHGDDNANNEKLIRELQGKRDRTGHYVCALALVYPDGREVTAEGYCDGLVQDEPKGENGFGYDRSPSSRDDGTVKLHALGSSLRFVHTRCFFPSSYKVSFSS